jgi:thiamine biosynthesis protein ThiS
MVAGTYNLKYVPYNVPVVAECDDRIIQRQNYASLELSENSKLELIRFVGGG